MKNYKEYYDALFKEQMDAYREVKDDIAMASNKVRDNTIFKPIEDKYLNTYVYAVPAHSFDNKVYVNHCPRGLLNLEHPCIKFYPGDDSRCEFCIGYKYGGQSSTIVHCLKKEVTDESE